MPASNVTRVLQRRFFKQHCQGLAFGEQGLRLVELVRLEPGGDVQDQPDLLGGKLLNADKVMPAQAGLAQDVVQVGPFGALAGPCAGTGFVLAAGAV